MIDIRVGGYVLQDGSRLRVDRATSPFIESVLRRLLIIVGDPDGNETFRAEITEGLCRVHTLRIWDVVTCLHLVYTVDLVAGRIEQIEPCWCEPWFPALNT